MDPTTNLTNIRERIAKIREMEGIKIRDLMDHEVENFFDLALLLADDVSDLDEWISGGGALPTPWGEAKPKLCPRCEHNYLHPRPARNALSRVAKTYICSYCGQDEAMLDLAGQHPWPQHPAPYYPVPQP